jgi:hypothetical protein
MIKKLHLARKFLYSDFILKPLFQPAVDIYEKREGSGSVLVTNRSGSGRPKNIRMRIRNTALEAAHSHLVEQGSVLLRQGPGMEPESRQLQLIQRQQLLPAHRRLLNKAAQAAVVLAARRVHQPWQLRQEAGQAVLHLLGGELGVVVLQVLARHQVGGARHLVQADVVRAHQVEGEGGGGFGVDLEFDLEGAGLIGGAGGSRGQSAAAGIAAAALGRALRRVAVHHVAPLVACV